MQHIGYILLSHGAKHSSLPLEERPGAATQIAKITHSTSALGRRVGSWTHDHARTPKGAASFPSLFSCLAFAREHNATGLVVLDDAARLFRRLSHAAQIELLEEIEPYHRNILDAHRQKLLSDLRQFEWLGMMTSALQTTSSAMTRRQVQASGGHVSTAKARRVSQASRARTAGDLARRIAGLREELSEGSSVPSHVELARVANERGLRTSRGNRWSDVAVARAIKRAGHVTDGK